MRCQLKVQLRNRSEVRYRCEGNSQKNDGSNRDANEAPPAPFISSEVSLFCKQLRQGESGREPKDALLYARDDPRLALGLQDIHYVPCYLFHFRDPHSPRRQGGSADPDARSHEGTFLVEGYAVLIDRDIRLVQPFLGILARNSQTAKIDEHKMVVGAAGDDARAALPEGRGHGLG